MHGLSVGQALNDLQVNAIRLSSGLSNKDAIYFLNHGVGRRVEMMRSSYHGLRSLVPFSRKDPLSSEEARDLCRDLNVIYINIVGTLDNFAWCLLHQLGYTKELYPSKVGLFSDELTKDSSIAPLSTLKTEFGAWFKDLIKLRNPAAHQIPLSIPPSVLNFEEYNTSMPLCRRSWLKGGRRMTVSEDIGSMIKVVRRVEHFLVDGGHAKPRW